MDGGVNLLSIANPQVSSLVTTQLVQPMVHTMEASGIHWLGLNAKCHHIAVVGGQRVGFIAMCAGHGQCLQSSQTPFAPVKYTSKVATSVVNNIKGVNNIDCMHGCVERNPLSFVIFLIILMVQKQ